MKQLWSAVILLAVMVLALGWNGSRLNGLIEPQQDTLDMAVLAAKSGAWEQAEELTRRVSHDWKDNISYLHFVQSHRDVDEITILLEESMEYAKSQNVSTYCAMNARIQGLMEGICKLETFSAENLI